MADEETPPGVEAPLVSVTFQRNPHQKNKYLESEPKALGITQIVLSVFHIISVLMTSITGMSTLFGIIPHMIGSVFVIIAGILAIAAQSLHLPTLKACLGMQVVACGASMNNFVFSVAMTFEPFHYCWYYENFQNSEGRRICNAIRASTTHFYAEWILIQIALFVMSATLAAYCCKVVRCCSAGERMPVITVQAAPPQQSVIPCEDRPRLDIQPIDQPAPTQLL
ncbi:hypothetical protein UPYG_G00087160 [Umbra pygmaea]|uniref:Membrane-spanning 4-domains subfamily A member 4A-like n=1 Tax=Umbra pygmaea TaxID=75934 RepID=A0ABD0XEX8_UMBPY